MEFDDVKENMDYCDNQRVEVKVKIDNLAENSEGILFGDGVDVDSVFAYKDRVCADRENGLKRNDAVFGDDQSPEAILDSGSGKIADEVSESEKGGTDCDPVSSSVTEFVEPASGETNNVDVRVVSMNNASVNEDDTSRHLNLVTGASLGIESGGKIQEMHEKLRRGLPTNTPGASITSFMIENSDVVPVPREDTNEESEVHAAHPQSSFPDESLAGRVNPGLECESDLALDNRVDSHAFDSAAQVDTHGEDQEMHDQAANGNVSVAGGTIAQSRASFRHDMNTHEQPSFPDELPLKWVNQQLECELGTSVGACLDKDSTNGLAQGVSEVEDIQDTQKRQAANVEQVVSINVTSARMENVIDLHNHATSVIVVTEVMHAESDMSKKVDTSTHIQDTEATDVVVDVSEVMNACTAPMEDDNDGCKVCVADEQHLLLDESLVGGLGQQEEADIFVGECFIKGATDGVALDGINMEGQQVPTPIQQIEQTVEKFVSESPESDSVKLHNKVRESARFEFAPDQHVELPETSLPTQQVQASQQVHGETLPDSENLQSMDEENVRLEVPHRQHCELPERATAAQQFELPEKQVDEHPVCDSANSQSNDERNTEDESTPTQQVQTPNTAVLTQQVELPKEQDADIDSFSNTTNLHNKNEENARHVSTSSRQEELPETAIHTQHDELLENKKDGVPVSCSEIPQSKDEENAGLESIFTRHVELPETAVRTPQADLLDGLVDEDPVSDPTNSQSIDEGNVRNESTPIQQVKLPETAVSCQQIELPEEQVEKVTVCDSANPQNTDEDNARNEYTPSQSAESLETTVSTQPGDLPETAVPAQLVKLPESQEADESLIFGSASPQSMDEDSVRNDSAPSQQEMELPDTAVPTQQVERAEEQEEDPLSDSTSPQSMDDDNTRNESVPIQKVSLSEAAVSSQQVELPGEQEADEDTVSDSENPQSMNEDDAGNGSSSTQQVGSPETAVSTEQVEFPKEQVVEEGPVPDSANPHSKFEKHVASVCAPQQVESPGTVVSTQQAELLEEKEVDEDRVSDSAKSRSKEQRRGRRGSAKPGGSSSNHWVTYRLPPEDDSAFSVFDLVWGKVKSHPWWPGQIFHPSDSSEKAMKYYKKDCYLVAYFGDRSFAWVDASVLKPFRSHFSQEEKQSTTESFQNAVKCALSEVSRRVELGLACSCISEAEYDKIKCQIVENGGIREESGKREGIDGSTGSETFHSDKLVEYVRALATSPTSGADRLDLVVAKAQLLAFNRLKGCDALAEFNYYDGLAEFDANSLPSGEKGTLDESEVGDLAVADDDKTKLKGPCKRKHNLKDIVYQRRKEKSLTELMGESMYYLDGEFDSHEEDDIVPMSPRSGSKRKASGYLASDFTTPPSTKTISFAKVSNTVSSNPQQSFNVGECIRRVAGQLTGSSSIIKCTSDRSDSKVIGDDVDEVIDAPDDSVTESTMIPQKQSSPEEMISQLHLSALDPMKGYSFLGDIISFFYEFRNAAVSTQRQTMRKGPGRKRKASGPAVGSPEAFEFDDKNDSYWTDMVVQNDSKANPARCGRKRKENQDVAVDSEKPLQSKRKYTRKQYFHESPEPSHEVPARDEKQEQLPTELVLNFGESGSIPSEVNLNKMFRRFGPLKESETEIDGQSGRARLVFKKRSDAEVAYSSAAMFNVFGSSPVIYQLNYTPSAPFGTSPLALSDTVEHGT